MTRTLIPSFLLITCLAFSADIPRFDFRVLATTKTSTMEKEMNDAAQAGFEFQSVMGGETAFGGKQVVLIMGRSAQPATKVYKLLAANKTSTLQREMQQLAQEGFDYKGQTIFESTLGGREVCVIMERDKNNTARPNEYKLLATSKTSTMDKELAEAGREGYRVVGMTVAKTSFGGNEVVSILKRAASE